MPPSIIIISIILLSTITKYGIGFLSFFPLVSHFLVNPVEITQSRSSQPFSKEKVLRKINIRREYSILLKIWLSLKIPRFFFYNPLKFLFPRNTPLNPVRVTCFCTTLYLPRRNNRSPHRDRPQRAKTDIHELSALFLQSKNHKRVYAASRYLSLPRLDSPLAKQWASIEIHYRLIVRLADAGDADSSQSTRSCFREWLDCRRST